LVCDYQLPLTQPPLFGEADATHERSVEPLSYRLTENVLPSVECEVTV
jgi:hypothetical protein